MATYGEKASDKVEEAMHERKLGTLKSGRSGKTVTSKKQAIAIGLSEARKEGGKVPSAKRAAKKTGAKTTATKKGSGRKTAVEKTTAKKSAANNAPARKAAKKSAAKRTS